MHLPHLVTDFASVRGLAAERLEVVVFGSLCHFALPCCYEYNYSTITQEVKGQMLFILNLIPARL